MIRSFLRWVVRWTVRIAILIGIGSFVAWLLREEPDGTDRSTPASAPSPTFGRGTTAGTARTGTGDQATTWVPPADGACPDSHPVKLKEASGIFHLPGDLAYERTVPDRCYRDAATAEAEGYRQAKR